MAKRKLDAAIHLYSEALIDADDFAHRRQALEREIAHWESWTSETERMRLELTMCIEAVEKLAFIWDHSEDEDRKGFVQHLFEWVEYDLDARRITQFQLKPWADRFIILRGALYDLEDAGNDDDVGPEEGGGQGKDSGAKKQNASPKEVKQAMPHRGLEPLFLP